MKDKCEACRKTWPDYGAATNALGCDLNPLCKANPQKCGLRDKRPNGCQWAKENASTKTCQGNMIDSIALAVGHEFKETLLEKVKTLVRSYDAARAELDTLWAERRTSLEGMIMNNSAINPQDRMKVVSEHPY